MISWNLYSGAHIIASAASIEAIHKLFAAFYAEGVMSNLHIEEVI